MSNNMPGEAKTTRNFQGIDGFLGQIAQIGRQEINGKRRALHEGKLIGQSPNEFRPTNDSFSETAVARQKGAHPLARREETAGGRRLHHAGDFHAVHGGGAG